MGSRVANPATSLAHLASLVPLVWPAHVVSLVRQAGQARWDCRAAQVSQVPLDLRDPLAHKVSVVTEDTGECMLP